MKTLISRTLAVAALCASFVHFSPEIHAQHGLLREVYTNIFGFGVDGLLASPDYPDNPSAVTVVSEFEAPQSAGDDYGQRLRGYVEAPQTGSYIFWIASDDQSRLYISNDEQPQNTSQIGEVFSFTQPREWEAQFEPNQRSQPIQLQQGKRYYIEALAVDGGGADHVAVRWQLPDGTIEEPIPNERLYVELIPPQIARQPISTTVTEGQNARFTVQVANQGPVLYQWIRNDQMITDATNSSLTIPSVTLADNGARIQVRISNAFATNGILSSTAFLTVRGDTDPPTIISAQTTGENDLVAVTFSERVEETSAETPANFRLTGGVRVLTATLSGDGRTVILNVSALTSGQTYTLTINNIRDRASQPNPIEPDSEIDFLFGLSPLAPEFVYGKAEVPGPSTRRTGLTISEIMYNPAPRMDNRNLGFVEIFNSQEFIESIGGYRLTGAIEYTFPEGTFIPARSHVVVAAAPVDIQIIYGLPRVFGPYVNSLPDAGTLQLLNDQGAILLEVPYDSQGEWPVAPDGAGPSLSLTRASYGEADPRAWSASEFVGGSPGRTDAPGANPYRGLVINEFLVNTDLPQVDFIELYNYSSSEIDLSGIFITDDGETNKYRVPNGIRIAPLGFFRIDEIDLGFGLSSSGERIILRNPQRTRVIDALRFGPQPSGVALGRFPDGAPKIESLVTPTPNAPNSRPSLPQVVINEIMYNPVSGNQNEEYIELYNRGNTALDLRGWRLQDGISFTFVQSFTLPAGGYLVVAKDADILRASHTNLTSVNTIGNFNGNLANDGERIALERPEISIATNGTQRVTNIFHVVMDAVRYETGGRWPRWADGGGSSMELIDAHSDNDAASNWADSNENGKSEWVTIERRGILDHGSTNFTATSPSRDLHVILMDGGEALLDDVEVIRDGSTNIVTNPGLERGLTGWQVGGTHEQSVVERGVGQDGGSALHILASERGDTAANRIRARLTVGLTNGSIATIRAKAKWLRGTPEILLRLHGNYLEVPGVMPLPKNLGTPGAANSRVAANSPPSISGVRHEPLLPVANQEVTVIAQVDDPDRLAVVSLNYRVDPGTNSYTRVPMSYNGAGFYSGKIPGQSNLVTTTFYIEAIDARAGTARFPASAPEAEGVILFDDRKLGGNFGTYRLWLSSRNLDRWARRERSSNHPIDATFVYNNERVVYNMGTLYSGSPFHWGNYNSPIGNSANYVMVFPDDDQFLGQSDFVLTLPSNLGSDNTGLREQVAFWMADQLNQPFNHRRYHHLFINGRNRGMSGTTQRVFEDAQQPNRDMIEQWYPQSPEGDFHKIEDWFEYSESFSFFNLDAELLALYTTNLTTNTRELKQERYRWWFRKRAVRNSAHDYSELLRLVEATNERDPEEYKAKTEALVDIDAWMGAIAFRHVVGDWDAFGYTRGKNMYAYKPTDGKWQLMHWDIAFAFGLGDSVIEDLFNVTHFDGTIDSITKKMMDTPSFRRSYYRSLYEAAHGPMLPSRVNSIIDARYNALVSNGISASSPDVVKQWIALRRDYILAQLANVSSGFSITSNNGGNFTTNRNTIILTGTAPVNIQSIHVNGEEYPVTWTSVTQWELRLALDPQKQTRLLLEGFDFLGNRVADTSITVTVTGQNESVSDRVVFNEIRYDAAAPETDFVELHNTSRNFSFDLSGCRINGLGFTFPTGSVIPPGGFLVIVKDVIAFADRYGYTVPIAGEFDGTLDSEGEALSLLGPDSTGANEIVISAIRFDSSAPWPLLMDGSASSLQVIDPNQDISRVANWSVQSNVATPAATNSNRGTLTEFPLVWVNEVQPQNLNGTRDAAGDRDPWLELYNSGANSLSLNGYFLTDDYANLTKWAFPANAAIGAGQRIVIWADAEVGESTATEWHTNFRLTPGTGSVALVGPRGVPTVLDFLNYETLGAGQSFGAFPEGQAVWRGPFFKPTPGAPNDLSGPGVQVFINEWMASNTRTIQDPDDLDFDDWFELYNAGSTTADLSGFALTDDFENPNQFRIPTGTTIPAGGFLLVWADNEQATNGQLHVSFRLSNDGDNIALIAPDGSTVDSVTFGPQLSDVSEGRVSDGGSQIRALSSATPGRSNGGIDPSVLQFTSVTASSSLVTFTWTSQSGETYLVEWKNSLSDPTWTTLRTVPASSSSTSTTDQITADRRARFYRLSRQ